MSGYTTNGLVGVTLPLTGNEKFAVDTQLANGLAPQSEAVTLSQLATYMGGNLPMVHGRFYGLPNGTTPVALLTVTATLYAYPIYIPNQITIATFNIGVTTGQTGGACHVGIYADTGAGYPGALVYDTGAISGLTSTTVVTNTPTTGPTLQAGWYWIASIFTASGTFPSVTAATSNYGTSLNAQLGSDTAAHLLATSGQAATGISVAGTYGALPSTFTASATLTLNAATPIFALGV
jgi:hypothetical protein